MKIPNDIPLPEFKKKRHEVSAQRRRAIFAAILLLAGASAVAFWATFRGLLSSSVSRRDILGEVFSSSESRRKSMLLEWISHLDTSDATHAHEYTPTNDEECRLLQFVEQHADELAVDQNTEALFALNVASWGPGCAYNFEPILKAASSDSAKLIAAIFLARQETLFQGASENSAQVQFLIELASDPSTVSRKTAALALKNCIAMTACQKSEASLLGDADEEVRWNAAFSVAREAKYFSVESISRSRDLINEVFEKIQDKNSLILQKFNGDALHSLLRELFSALFTLEPEKARAKIEALEKSHSDLRVRNAAREFLLSPHSN